MDSEDVLDGALVCKPIDNYKDLVAFVSNPPPWTSQCKELVEHSKQVLRNGSLISSSEDTLTNDTEYFCHIDPGSQIVEERLDSALAPKTLVCHDMANGYHDDSFLEGTRRHDAYTFYNWAGIDIFCYFSHHLITIPPLGWINVAHAHGVKVIGTFITEWEDGKQFWEEMLSHEDRWLELARLLTSVARVCKFDGWLLNIENQLTNGYRMVQFVTALHEALHNQLPNPVLLWYDSVTVDGKLEWQNGLTEKNEAFFLACDGIFTNYSWSESMVEGAAIRAGGRRRDVFVGVDVWGRNMYGGGRYNTRQAVQVARKYGCSVAIFAAAWSYEAATRGFHESVRGCHAVLRDRALWDSLWLLLYTHLPAKLPFATSFCRGQGLKKRMYGQEISTSPWYNLSLMQYQPNSNHGPQGYMLTHMLDILRTSTQEVFRHQSGTIYYRKHFYKQRLNSQISLTTDINEELLPISHKEDLSADAELNLTSVATVTSKLKVKPGTDIKTIALAAVPGELECLEYYTQDSFNGGGCLKVNSTDEICLQARKIKLLYCDFHIENELIVCLVTKKIGSKPFLLELECVTERGLNSIIVLSECPDYMGVLEECRNRVSPMKYTSIEFRELRRYLLKHEPGFYVPVDNIAGWNVKYYCVRGGCHVTALRCAGAALLGHVGLADRKDKTAEYNDVDGNEEVLSRIPADYNDLDI